MMEKGNLPSSKHTILPRVEQTLWIKKCHHYHARRNLPDGRWWEDGGILLHT